MKSQGKFIGTSLLIDRFKSHRVLFASIFYESWVVILHHGNAVYIIKTEFCISPRAVLYIIIAKDYAAYADDMHLRWWYTIAFAMDKQKGAVALNWLFFNQLFATAPFLYSEQRLAILTANSSLYSKSKFFFAIVIFLAFVLNHGKAVYGIRNLLRYGIITEWCMESRSKGTGGMQPDGWCHARQSRDSIQFALRIDAIPSPTVLDK